jgi:hypothetical protein
MINSGNVTKIGNVESNVKTLLFTGVLFSYTILLPCYLKKIHCSKLKRRRKKTNNNKEKKDYRKKQVIR